MTAQAQNNSLVQPELLDTLLKLKADIFRSMNCVKIGSINKFDLTKKTAEVQILFKRIYPDAASPNGQTVASVPLLVDVPVVTLQGGGAALEMPISVGDQCLVFFSDRNIDAWFKNGAEAAPFDGRTHDLSDGIALVGVNALNGTLPDYVATEARLISGVSRLGVLKDGSMAFLRYSDTVIWSDSTGSHMNQGDATVEVKGGKVGIAGTGGTLLAALEGIIDVLKALLVQDPVSGPIPLTAGSIAALEAQKAILEGVLNS